MWEPCPVCGHQVAAGETSCPECHAELQPRFREPDPIRSHDGPVLEEPSPFIDFHNAAPEVPEAPKGRRLKRSGLPVPMRRVGEAPLGQVILALLVDGALAAAVASACLTFLALSSVALHGIIASRAPMAWGMSLLACDALLRGLLTSFRSASIGQALLGLRVSRTDDPVAIAIRVVLSSPILLPLVPTGMADRLSGTSVVKAS